MGTPDRENIMRVTNWCFYLRLLTLLHYVYFLEFHIADGGSMGDVGRGRGNIIKLASSTGHDIVQVTGHAFTRVRTLIYFRYRSWDGYRPVSDFVDIFLIALWGKLLLLEDYNRL